jgi:hypothetical protein
MELALLNPKDYSRRGRPWDERKAPGQQKRPGSAKRYATGDVARVTHTEVDARCSHQQYDPNRHRQDRDLVRGSLKMPGTKEWALSNRGMPPQVSGC